MREDPGLKISMVEKKRAIVAGLTNDFDITTEFVMSTGLSYEKVVSELIVKEPQLAEMEMEEEKAFISQEQKKTKKCRNSKTKWRVVKIFW